MSDKLKRKRSTLAEDAIPILKRGGSRKNRNTAKNSDLSLANTTTTDTTGNTNIGSTVSDTSPTRDSKTNTPDETPSKPTLQSLPRELRNLIYAFVAATEERIVLGRRMAKACHYKSRTQTLYESFKGAIALHPLSMTCHQFLDEFQGVHVAASEPSWALVVNNFDLDQIRCFSDFIQSEQYIKATKSTFYHKKDEHWEDWGHGVPSYNFNVSLRFQMDSHALKSANDLSRYILCHEGEAPRSLASPDITRRWFGVAEISTQYVPRTSTPVDESKGMTLEQARKISSEFCALRETLFDVLDEMEMCGERDFGGEVIADSWDYMEWCWFDPFNDALIRMEDVADEASK